MPLSKGILLALVLNHTFIQGFPLLFLSKRMSLGIKALPTVGAHISDFIQPLFN
jgi:hypothetical protein